MPDVDDHHTEEVSGESTSESTGHSARSLHIVQVLPELNEGGVERGVVELNRELIRLGHRSSVICARGKLSDDITQAGGEVRYCDVCSKNPLTALVRAMKLRRVLNDLGPDVIHVRSRVPGWLVRVANKSPVRPLVTTVHGYNSVSAYSRIMTRGGRVICVSQGIRDFIKKHYQTPDERIRVIFRGVDLREFDTNALDAAFMDRFQKEHGLTGRQVITAVGRISELKNYELLIEAVSKLVDGSEPTGNGAEGCGDWLLLIVGGCREDKRGYLQSLKDFAAERGVADRVVFAGSQRQVAEVYAVSDVLVSCSKKPESFGRSLVEAMAMGTPVIAPKHGGAVEIVTDSSLGRLFKPNDADSLARALADQLSSPPADGQRLRAQVAERFSLDAMVTAVAEVYQEVCRDKVCRR